MSGSLVMVAVKDPAHADELVKLACRIVKGDGAEVLAVSVSEIAPSLPIDADSEVLDRPSKEALEQATKVGGSCETKIRTRLLRAREAGPALVEEARELGANLLVIGYHGRLGIGEVLRGSCVQYVASHAPCRVVMAITPPSAQ